MITKDIAQQHLEAWLKADLAVSQGKSYSIAGRTLTRADAQEIRDQIAYWTSIASSLNGGRLPKIKIASFKDFYK